MRSLLFIIPYPVLFTARYVRVQDYIIFGLLSRLLIALRILDQSTFLLEFEHDQEINTTCTGFISEICSTSHYC